MRLLEPDGKCFGRGVLMAMLAVGLMLAANPAQADGDLPASDFQCPSEPDSPLGAPRGTGGMAGVGWDGPDKNAATIYWHVEGATSDFGTGQRTAIIDALQAWADVVQIDFIELAVPNQNVAIDLHFAVGEHSDIEPQELGKPACRFDGPGGVLAHAGFPPDVTATCPGPLAETMAGNVHFDEDETWEQDSEGPVGAISMTLVACHEIGHGLGLTHSAGPTDVMRATFTSTNAFSGLSSSDITFIRDGYLAGTGSVTTLEDTGVWVDNGYGGQELGTVAKPFDTVGEGAAGVPPASTDVVLHIEAGSYPEAVTITQAMILQPENGVVTIGN